MEGVRSLGAALNDESFVLPQQGMRPILGLYGSVAARDCSPPGQCRFSGRDGLRLRQGFGGHVRAVPISKAEAVRKHRLCRRIAGAGIRTLFLSNGQLCNSQIFHIKLINLETAQMNLLYQHFANNQASDRHKTNG